MEQHWIDSLLSISTAERCPGGSELAIVQGAFDNVIRKTDLITLSIVQKGVVARAILVAFEKDHDMDSLVAAGHTALNIYAR